MRLIGELTRIAEGEESLFRAQLLREDVARLAKLASLAQREPDLSAFRKAGMQAGWTQGDARTHELREPLERLLDEVHAWERGDRSDARDGAIIAAWQQLHRTRMERLLGCLSTPAPKPVE